jgi:antitoxin (DNA-binding transcriptional repressor) of toxin-antitoxin stability system
MRTATVRDLRTKFPTIESWLADGRSVLITKQGRPVAMLSKPPADVAPDFNGRFGAVEPSSLRGPVQAVRTLLRERGD